MTHPLIERALHRKLITKDQARLVEEESSRGGTDSVAEFMVERGFISGEDRSLLEAENETVIGGFSVESSKSPSSPDDLGAMTDEAMGPSESLVDDQIGSEDVTLAASIDRPETPRAGDANDATLMETIAPAEASDAGQTMADSVDEVDSDQTPLDETVAPIADAKGKRSRGASLARGLESGKTILDPTNEDEEEPAFDGFAQTMDSIPPSLERTQVDESDESDEKQSRLADTMAPGDAPSPTEVGDATTDSFSETVAPETSSDLSRGGTSNSGTHAMGATGYDETVAPDEDQHSGVSTEADGGSRRESTNREQRSRASDEAGTLSSLDQLNGKPRYELKKELARGGLGRVWLAQDQHIARNVAIKEVLPGRQSGVTLDRFYQEAQITGQLEHPGIVPVYELGMKPDGKPFYTMKLLRGRTFESAIREYHELPRDDPNRVIKLNELLDVFVGICNAMAFAHNKGIIHRDLKPANVMVGDFGEAIVVDWGLATIMHSQRDPLQPMVASEEDTDGSRVSITLRGSGSQTMAGTIMGTPKYMSPEQAEGRIEELDERSDIYSLGAILYDILVGSPALNGASLQEILTKVIRGEFEPPKRIIRDVPAPLNAICLKAMALEADDRYANAKEIAEDVLRWKAREPVSAYPEPWWQQANRWLRKHRTLVLSTVAAASVVVIGLVAWNIQEAQRIAAIRDEATRRFNEGQAAFYSGDLNAAQLQLGQSLALVSDEPMLEELHGPIDELLGKATALLAEEDAREEAQERLARFEELRDEALFHGTRVGGLDDTTSVLQTRDAATEALQIFSKGAETGFEPDQHIDHLTDQERQEVREAQREMVMLLADAIAFPLPGQQPQERRENAAEALTLLVMAEKLGTPFRSLYLRRADLHANLGQRAESAEALAKAEGIEPANAFDYFLLGFRAYDLDKFNTAIGFFKEALNRDTDNFWAQYFLGLSLYKTEQYRAASIAFTACLAQRDDFLWTYLLRGVANSNAGDAKAAEADFAEAMRIDKDEYGIYVNRGSAYFNQGRYDDAIKDFKRAIAINPDSYRAYFNLAMTYRKMGRFEDALDRFDDAIQRAPEVAEVYGNRGLLHLEDLKDQQAAAADFENAIRFAVPGSSQLANYRIYRGKIFHDRRQFEAALAQYDEALKQNDEVALVHYARGQALFELRRFQEAREAFDRFMETSDDEVTKAYVDRGSLREALGDVQGAVEDFTLALAADERTPAMHAKRGWKYVMNWKELALADFNEAIKLAPRDPGNYSGRGYTLALSGDYLGAVRDAEKAVALSRGVPTVLYDSACVYSVAYDKARTSTDEKHRTELANAYRAKALELLRGALERIPANRRAGFIKGAILPDPSMAPLKADPAFKSLMEGYLNPTPKEPSAKPLPTKPANK
ncbi:Serine/threonine-protein kinase PknD [Planctomycetes bacterium Pan216]|uniref:Serine/threonine-protein kinase PknD n=1 Tax=Kolteria novifilia TaxID=2527975 RepID=A0A518B3Z1_9BACT|nr:Serine/threonine-protein kinase PknD [Planctomycetes bacterium Pan216]